MTTVDQTFAELLAGEMTRITTGRYRTQRKGGHVLDRNERSLDRRFWPGVQFAPTTVSAGPVLTTTFMLGDDDRVFGFRVDVSSAVERWNIRVGLLDAVARPATFAAELCWYLVVLIGDADLDVQPDRDGIRWINIATDVFGGLRTFPAN